MKHGSRACAAAIAVALAFACGSDEQRRARHLARAEDLAAESRRREAVLELRAALRIADDAAVRLRVGELLEAEGDREEALFYYREAGRLDPALYDAPLAEARLLLPHDPMRARALVDQVLARVPDLPTAHLRSAELALAAGDVDAARRAARTATELAPGDGAAWRQLGIAELARVHLHRLRGETAAEGLAESERALQRADALLGGDPATRADLGRLYAVWPGRGARAGAAFRGAVAESPPGEPRARAAGAAAGYARLAGDAELLRWSLDELVANRPAGLAAWDALAELEERREAGAGEAVYRRLLAERPDDAGAHARFAGFLARRDRFDDARAWLEARVRSGPDPARALDELVALELSRGALEPARETLARLAREHAGHPRHALATGRVRLAERRADEAAEALRDAVAREPGVDGERLLAVAELARGDVAAARTAIDRALALAPGDGGAELLRLRARILEAAGDWPGVLATLNRLVGMPGARPRAADELRYARALYETGRARLGRRVLERMLETPEPPLAALLEFAHREGATEPVRAQEALEAILGRVPRHETALRALVARDVAAGDAATAQARLARAAAEDGELPPGLLVLRAQVRASSGDAAGAEQDARRALAAAPAHESARALLVGLLVGQGRADEAAALLEAEPTPTPRGQLLLAQIHLSAGRAEPARALYEAALAAGGDLPVAKNDLAWLLAEAGAELDRAQQLAEEACASEPENPEFADTLGFVLLRQGRAEPALERLREALELAARAGREPALLHHHVGLALRALGRDEEAAAAFERALAVDPGFTRADEARRELEVARRAAAPG